MLNVITIVNGELQENAYIVHNNIDALIIDPGSDIKKIENEIKSNNLNVQAIMVTHYHDDHVHILEDVKELYKDAKLIDYKSDSDQIIGTFKFQILETFGHTLDSVTFYFSSEELLFTGDFIFKGTIGNFQDDHEIIMANSLNIFKYIPKSVKIYPGHGKSTTVLNELEKNPFLRGI